MWVLAVVQEAKCLLERRTNQLDSYIAQKSKVEWVKNGEERSAAFFRGLQQNRKRSSIWSLQNAGGETVTDRELIAAEIVHFFRSLFGSEVVGRDPSFAELQGPVIEYDLHSVLSASCSDLEVWNALQSIGNVKSPGPNGFGIRFVKHC